MKIFRAEHLGMCFGVRDAIALATRQAASGPLTVLGDLVHNETVLSELRARGITIEQEAAKVRTQTVMVTAHGASERALGCPMRSHHDCLRSNLRRLLLDGDSPGAQFGQNCFVVDEIAENRERTGRRLPGCPRD